MGKTFSARRILVALTSTIALMAIVPTPASAQFASGLQPEDAFNHYLTASADGERLYSAATNCDSLPPPCDQVLFESTDGGTTWEQLPARLFDGHKILIPPDAADQRIFALAAGNLQVSEDGGQTFRPTAPAFQAVSAAISPAFNEGDPTFLIGGTPTTMYNDETHVVTPLPGVLSVGPSNPAFSPGYPDDSRLFFGHNVLGDEPNTIKGAVTVCVDHLVSCSTTEVGTFGPEIRFAPDFAEGGALYAFDQRGVHVSNDGGETFEDITPPERATIWDFEVLDDGSLLVARTFNPFQDPGAEGLFRSTDGGVSWTRVSSPMLDVGVFSLAAGGDTVVAALTSPGLGDEVVCSDDGGLTWASRCP